MPGFNKDGFDKAWTASLFDDPGHVAGERIFPHLPRLTFDEAALIG